MSGMTASIDAFTLPWEFRQQDGVRLRRWLMMCGAFALVASLVVPWLPVPEIVGLQPEAVKVEPTRIVLAAPRPVVVPPPPLPPQNPPSATPARAIETPRPAPAPTVAPQQDRASAAEPTPDAREVAASSGLLALQDTLTDLRGAVDTGKLANASIGGSSGGAAATVDHSRLAAHQGSRSGGVNEETLSRDTGGVALTGRETTRIEAPATVTGSGATGAERTADPRQRSIEDIRRVFDANKGAIFAIYHRALRTDPALRGQVVLELLIEPGGAVAEIRVVTTELKDDELMTRLLSRIRMFDFGARDVGTTRISYLVHFLPG